MSGDCRGSLILWQILTAHFMSKPDHARMIPSNYQALIANLFTQKDIKNLPPVLQDFFQVFLQIHNQFVDIQTLYPRQEGNYVTGRYPGNVFTVQQAEFEGYPAAKISTGDVIAEGPTEENYQLLLDKLLTQKIDIIFAVGKPDEIIDGKIREKFFTYFSPEEQVHSITFFKHLDPSANFESNLGNDFEESQIKIYSKQNFFVIHLPNWPDHDLPNFTMLDKQFLTLILLSMIRHHKSACFHCSAGIGRSPALLFTKLLFEKARENSASLINLELMGKLLIDIKNVKPAAGEWQQILAAVGLVEDLLICSKQLEEKFRLK